MFEERIPDLMHGFFTYLHSPQVNNRNVGDQSQMGRVWVERST